MSDERRTAIFGGGCFWCMEGPFADLDGVLSARSGYCGGETKNPTYRDVCSGTTGHAEVVEVVYDPEVIDYETLLAVFWRNIDPTTPNRQFCDSGSQYRSVIFYADEEQRRLAEASKQTLERERPSLGPIVTEIAPAAPFYLAEEYHLDFRKKSREHYEQYRQGSGRDRRLRELWGEKKEP